LLNQLTTAEPTDDIFENSARRGGLMRREPKTVFGARPVCCEALDTVNALVQSSGVMLELQSVARRVISRVFGAGSLSGRPVQMGTVVHVLGSDEVARLIVSGDVTMPLVTAF
jgi:hypothetical protein